MSAPRPEQTIADLDAFRALHGTPFPGAVAKVINHVDAHARAFLARSPFLLIASRGETGGDCSPRGDAPGFVRVLDDSTLLIPERPGNRRADTLVNILDDPRIALLALVPGMNETLRVNGRAWLVDDAELLEPCSVRGKAPTLGIWVHVEELFMHCPKAFVRSALWDASRHIDRREMPTLGNMILDQITAAPHDAADPAVLDVDARLDEDARENLY